MGAPEQFGARDDEFWSWYGWRDLDSTTEQQARKICEGETYVLNLTACDWENARRGSEVILWQTRALVSARQRSAGVALHRAIDAFAMTLGQSIDFVRVVAVPEETSPFAATAAPVDLTVVVAHDFSAQHPR